MLIILLVRSAGEDYSLQNNPPSPPCQGGELDDTPLSEGLDEVLLSGGLLLRGKYDKNALFL